MKRLYFIWIAVFFVSLSHAQVQIGAANYATLKDAFSAINSGVHTGNISIGITGNTIETGIARLNANGTPDGLGNHANYSSIIISPSGTGERTILLTGGSLLIDNASYLTIDGQNRLTIANAQATATTIEVVNGASNNTISNCKVLGSGINGVIRIAGGVFGNPTNNTVTHCDIGPYDGNLPVNGIYLSSGIYVALANTVITYNNIYDYNSTVYNSAGISLEGQASGFTFQSNRIYQTSPLAGRTKSGIYVNLSQGEYPGDKIISGNQIGSASALGTGMYTLTSGSFTGILYQHLNSTGLVSIHDNTIRNVSVSGDVSGVYNNSPLLGISIRSGLAEIKDNTIGSQTENVSLVLDTTSGLPTALTGIYKDGNNNITINGNTIGGLSASGGGRVDITGIYMERNGDGSPPHMVCSENIIGGTLANSIVSNSGANNALVAGILQRSMLGPISGNTIRNLTGYGSGISSDPTGVIGIKSFVSAGGTYGNVSDNTVSNLTNANPSSAGYVAGIYEYCSQNFITIERNSIHTLTSLSTDTGALVTGIQIGGAGANLYNNMIAIGETDHDAARILGIRAQYFEGYNPNVKNNSVYIGGTATYGNAGSIAYYQDNSQFNYSNHDNIFANNRTNAGATGTHSSIRVDSAGTEFRGNIYYGNGNGYVLGYNGTTPKTTLAAWNNWSYPSLDYGYFTDPHFIAPTAAVPNLHIDPTVPTMAEGHGSDNIGIDIDLESRGDLTPNDIGADAGNFIAITQPVITDLSATSVCNDNETLVITGTGFTGVTQVRIGSTAVTIISLTATTITVPAGTVPLSGNVFVTNEAGTGSSSAVFSVYAPPVMTLQPVSATVCADATATFSAAATGASGYRWLINGSPLVNAPPFAGVTTTTLTVANPGVFLNGSQLTFEALSPANGCSTTSDAVILTVNPVPVPVVQAAGNTTFCAGTSMTLSTTQAYASYLWSNGAVTPTIDVSATGNYSVTVTLATGGCPATSAALPITVNPNATYYRDADSDAFGDAAFDIVSCTGAPEGFVADHTDCNDSDGTKHQTYPFYADNDGDTYGAGTIINVCNADTTPPSGYALDNTDCNDSDPTKHQTYPFYIDNDGDGHGVGSTVNICNADAIPPSGYATVALDCNDDDNAVYQNALLYTDQDGDGYSTGSAVMCYGASVPAGYSLTSNGSDCNDSDPSKHQTFTFYTDADGDTYGASNPTDVCAVAAGIPPSGYVLNNTDCDDSDALKHQMYPFYADNDNDGYGSGSLMDVCAQSAATPPMWTSLDHTDCDNNNAAIHPGTSEILYDGLDNNCDGQFDEGFQIKTQLVAEDCGVTLAGLDSVIHIASVGPQVWAYRIKAINGGNEQTIITYFPEFRMTDFPSYAYASTYDISIELLYNGVWLGYYGNTCQVTTPTPADAIYESYVQISSNGAPGVFYDMQATTVYADFNGANLGTFLSTNSLILKGGRNKIYNFVCPVSNSNLYYRVYKTGTAPGDFNVIPESFVSHVAIPGGQLWESASGTENLLIGLSTGNYILEVYSTSGFECSPFTSASNNNGNNYKATFSVTDPLPVLVTATLGTPTGQYANLTAAFSAINSQTHKGDIVITVIGNTFEQGSGAQLFPTNYDSIRIVPQGNVTVSASPTAGAVSVLMIINGHNITIDGLNTGGNSLTIANLYNPGSAQNFAPVTAMFNNCNTINVTNCRLLGASKYVFNSFDNTSTQGGMIVSFQASNNITVTNCDFGSSSDQHTPLYAISASGNNYIIANNTIHDYFADNVASAGIYCPGFASNWNITNNKFYQTLSRYWPIDGAEHGAIVVAPATANTDGIAQGFTITGNVIGYAAADQTGIYSLRGNANSPKARFCGIRFKGFPGATAASTTISNNTIASVGLTETTSRGSGATAPFVGISFESGVGTCNGNSIGSQTATGSLNYSGYTFFGAAEIYGIFNSSANPWTSDNNTIGGITADNTYSSQSINVYGIKSAGGLWSAGGNIIGGTVANSIRLVTGGSMCGLYGNTTATLTSNTVRNFTTNAVVSGIQLDGSNNTVSRNFVYNLAASTMSGIRINGGASLSSNNMIALGSGVDNAAINGLYDSGSGNSFYNNSIYIGGTAATGNANSFALFGTGGGMRNYINNILVNSRTDGGGVGKNYGIGISSATGLAMNRNLYYANGSGNVFGQFNFQDVTNLTSWKTATGQESGSFFADPKFISPTADTPDLHINPNLASVIESNGDILALVAEDYDGQARSALTPADIGADAGNFTAPPPAITGLSTLSGCPGTSLVISGSNMGSVTSVTVGGIAAPIVSVSAFAVTVTVGAGNSGAVSVYNGETGTATDAFTLIPEIAYYQDADNDGYGNPAAMQMACPGAPAGYVTDNTDCDDTRNTVHPGAVEIGYNLIDDDCDGQIDEGFPPKTTVLQGAQCNTTLAVIDTQVTANLVAGAQGYRWRITTMSGPTAGQVQFIDTALRTMKITQLANYAFNTVYKIEVAVLFSGFWQPFTSSGCTITTPAATTQLSVCGQTMTAMNDVVYANIVPFCTGYRFRITDPAAPSNMQIIDRPIREFRMNLVTNFTVRYGKTYTVEAAIRNTDGSYLPYGPACSLNTPVFPTTSLQDAQCSDYAVPTNATQIYAVSYAGAIGYVFSLTGPGMTAGQEIVKSTRTFCLNDFIGVIPGASYNVKVRLIFNTGDLPGPYGKTCTIVAPGLSRTVQTKTVFDAAGYPNPFAENFHIEVVTPEKETVAVKIYDMAGRLLESSEIETSEIKSVNLGTRYPSGVYNVIVSQGDNVKTLRMIKR